MTTAPSARGASTRKVELDVSKLKDHQKVPPPKYRHAAPSAPWPWMDFKKDDAKVPQLSPNTDEPWSGYPQSCFGNWTPDQVERCRMLTICKDQVTCRIHRVDVSKDGEFHKPGRKVLPRQIPSDPTSAKKFWQEMQKPLDSNLRVRAIFIESLTLDVLKILGERYTIEPFFFASSANWIPSRYQEDPGPTGDHITIVLPFIRVVDQGEKVIPTTPHATQDISEQGPQKLTDEEDFIDTQAPLVLSDQKILIQDLLAIHMIRSTRDNVIISYHHQSELQKTTAGRLQSLVQRTGDSVYWSKIYGRSRDPTFVFLAILWYALYAWDEAMEVLYEHLSEQLEPTDVSEPADVKTNRKRTRLLHKLQAHLLYYQQLLRDFRKSVEFVRDTPNPAMDEDPDQEKSMKLLKLESEHLLSEIQRLERQREIQSGRLQNMIDLSFSTIRIEDNKRMRELTAATMQDSAAMKLISYLTMVFLPANFVASVFGMNTKEINPGPPTGQPPPNTLASYIESTVILMAITAWVVIALQDPSSFHPGGRHFMKRVAWPVFSCYTEAKKLITRFAIGRAADADAHRAPSRPGTMQRNISF